MKISKLPIVVLTLFLILITGSCNIKNINKTINGSGDIEVNVEKSLDATVNGSGGIIYFGNPNDLKQKINGSGDITQKYNVEK